LWNTKKTKQKAVISGFMKKNTQFASFTPFLSGSNGLLLDNRGFSKD